ncbi:MAG: hypothetical protein H7Z76_04285 [Methylotenera sp.]|nr:hypothetical protein [Flavobacterium sp.]
MKSSIVNVRIPLEIKNALIKEANQSGKNLSDNIREILTSHSHKLENKDSILGSEMYNTSEFIFLFAWILEKRRCQDDDNKIDVINDLKCITYKVINDESLPIHIREEFEKVHFDLKRYIKNFGSVNNSFDFCDPKNRQSFDYSHLLDHIRFKAFENKMFS